jgi:hypothetical protein
MALTHQKNVFARREWIVTTILFLSLLLRWALVIRGGQYYFSDEQRYQVSQDVSNLIVQGKLGEAFSHLFAAPEHLGFKIIGILPALIEKVTVPSLVIPALFFSLFSVLNLYLVFLLAQRAGATQSESLFALALAAASHSLLYYSRHLMPYDTAMSFGLLSLYIALKPVATLKTSLLCGALSFLCFITYNGYWILAGFAMLCHAFAAKKEIAVLLRRGILLTIGFALPLLLLLLAARWTGIDLIAEYTEFAGTVNQGEYSEGWSLPFEYFWHTEYFLLVILGILTLLAVFHILKSNDRYPLWWLAGLSFVYACLVLFSVYFHSFVVLGRLARQMMPFVILLSAYGLARLATQTPVWRNVSVLVIFLVVLQGLTNYGISFAQSYPGEFSSEAQAQYEDFTFSQKRLIFGAPSLCHNNGYAMENAKYFLTATETNPEINGTVLLSESHPVNFLPYQYEGYTPDQRRQFRQRNLQMTFYKLDDDAEMKDIKNCFVNE